jgi:transcriptional regulator with XRE-family HTH domain
LNKSEKRKQQIDWLSRLSDSSGYNFKQITEHTNFYAKKNNIKPISDSVLRVFMTNKQGSVLHNRTLNLISEAFNYDLPSELSDSYSMSSDNSDASEYVKLCKQYITDVCEAKGYTKSRLAELIGKSINYFNKLFNNQQVKGLNYSVLKDIEEASGVKISIGLQQYGVEEVNRQNDYISINSYLSLSASDEVIPFDKVKKVISPFTNSDNIEAIELQGPTINPSTKDGVIYFYEKTNSDAIPENCIDSLCLVETEDDIKSIKFVSRSSKAGLFRLQSIINNSVEHKAIKCASKILYVAL